jgi:hypothetical protein
MRKHATAGRSSREDPLKGWGLALCIGALLLV